MIKAEQHITKHVGANSPEADLSPSGTCNFKTAEDLYSSLIANSVDKDVRSHKTAQAKNFTDDCTAAKKDTW